MIQLCSLGVSRRVGLAVLTIPTLGLLCSYEFGSAFAVLLSAVLSLVLSPAPRWLAVTALYPLLTCCF